MNRSGLSRVLAICICVGLAIPAFSQSDEVLYPHVFDRTFPVTIKEPVKLDIELGKGDLEVRYARDGQVSVTIATQGPQPVIVDRDQLANVVSIRQDGNHLELRPAAGATLEARKIKLSYRLDVPYRTELHSLVEHGNQSIIGIMGPVAAKAKQGDIKISYVPKEVDVRTEAGNLDLEVVAGRIEAAVGIGDISCTRAPSGIHAQTNEGQISLIVVGPSIATVKTGNGGIDAQGVRGTLAATTAAGDVHVKAVPHDDWKLTTASGNVRIEFPPQAGVDLDASSTFGAVAVNRDDMEKPMPDAHHLQQKINGGGKQIIAHTDSGKVMIR
jgi:hypothetical protein